MAPSDGDDEAALRIAEQLVRDGGFEPVTVGALDHARLFDMGTPVYDTGLPGPDVRRLLGLPPN